MVTRACIPIRIFARSADARGVRAGTDGRRAPTPGALRTHALDLPGRHGIDGSRHRDAESRVQPGRPLDLLVRVRRIPAHVHGADAAMVPAVRSLRTPA